MYDGRLHRDFEDPSPHMTRLLATLPLAAVFFTAPAMADELIRHANDQETLILGASRQRAGLQSVDNAGARVFNETSGGQIEFGYANTRVQTLFGVPNIYTRVEFSLGLGRQNFAGNPTDPSTGVIGTSNGPFDVDTESLRLRVGYSREFGPGGRMALTPFVGLAQHAWLRDATTFSGTSAYYDYAAELGLLGQASLTRKLVLGVEAGLGRIVGASQIDKTRQIAPRAGNAPSFALILDNRTSANWHQRFIIRHSTVRYGEPAQAVGLLEPRRNSALSLQLEFGTELDLFKLLFH
jgi:hypothetical protein